MADQYKRLPKRVQAIVDRVRAGQTLCKSLRLKETGETEVAFFFDPSNRRAGPKSAQAAVDSGLLAPNNDGLLGPESSQTWKAA